MTTLKPNDKLKSGDLIQTMVQDENNRSYISGFTPPPPTSWTEPRPITPSTIGRTILPGDLITAKYFRP